LIALLKIVFQNGEYVVLQRFFDEISLLSLKN